MSSVPPPPDRPTQPLRPSPPPPRVEERVVERGVDMGAVLAGLEDTIESLRTALMIVGALAVIALGIAIYALLSDDEGGSRAGLASDERGRIRRHINVFVNGEPGDGETAVQEDDKVYILPAISGG